MKVYKDELKIVALAIFIITICISLMIYLDSKKPKPIIIKEKNRIFSLNQKEYQYGDLKGDGSFFLFLGSAVLNGTYGTKEYYVVLEETDKGLIKRFFEADKTYLKELQSGYAPFVERSYLNTDISNSVRKEDAIKKIATVTLYLPGDYIIKKFEPIK